VHAVAVVFDFMQPLVAFRRHIDQLRELRPYPLRQRGRLAAPRARYAARHRGAVEKLSCRRRMRLLEVIDFADMLSRMGELEADAFAMPAGRKAPAFDNRHFVRHVGMRGIVPDRVDAGLRHDFAGLVFLHHVLLRIKLIDDLGTGAQPHRVPGRDFARQPTVKALLVRCREGTPASGIPYRTNRPRTCP
jgi:hypothetical protein